MAEESPLLPELARSLRTLGVARDACSEAAQTAVFAPLLEARRRAGLGRASEAIDALGGEALASGIERRTADAVRALVHDPAEHRAMIARARQVLEPLRESLRALDSCGAAVLATGSSPRSSEWELWVAQLRRVFACADMACGELALVLVGPASPSRNRWLGGRRR